MNKLLNWLVLSIVVLCVNNDNCYSAKRFVNYSRNNNNNNMNNRNNNTNAQIYEFDALTKIIQSRIIRGEFQPHTLEIVNGLLSAGNHYRAMIIKLRDNNRNTLRALDINENNSMNRCSRLLAKVVSELRDINNSTMSNNIRWEKI